MLAGRMFMNILRVPKINQRIVDDVDKFSNSFVTFLFSFFPSFNSRSRQVPHRRRLGAHAVPYSGSMRSVLLRGEDNLQGSRWLHGHRPDRAPTLQNEPITGLGQAVLRVPRGRRQLVLLLRQRATVRADLYHR